MANGELSRVKSELVDEDCHDYGKNGIDGRSVANDEVKQGHVVCEATTSEAIARTGASDDMQMVEKDSSSFICKEELAEDNSMATPTSTVLNVAYGYSDGTLSPSAKPSDVRCGVDVSVDDVKFTCSAVYLIGKDSHVGEQFALESSKSAADGSSYVFHGPSTSSCALDYSHKPFDYPEILVDEKTVNKRKYCSVDGSSNPTMSKDVAELNTDQSEPGNKSNSDSEEEIVVLSDEDIEKQQLTQLRTDKKTKMKPPSRKRRKLAKLQCEHCDKKFKCREYFRVHERMHTGDMPYVCDICGMNMASAGNLNRHKVTHTGEARYKCSQCGNCYRQSSALNRHILKHGGLKPHVCAICPKIFARADLLKYHVQVHKGQKPHNCEICSKKYVALTELTRHMKNAHNDLDDKKNVLPFKDTESLSNLVPSRRSDGQVNGSKLNHAK